MVHLIWSPQALEDFDAILSYIERDSPYYARLFGEKILAMVDFIQQNPHLGSVVAEYNIPNLRERILQNYRIVYRVLADRIELVTICHAARILRIQE